MWEGGVENTFVSININVDNITFYMIKSRIYFTSFFSTPYWSNSEHWSQNLLTVEHPFHNIRCLCWSSERSTFNSIATISHFIWDNKNGIDWFPDLGPLPFPICVNLFCYVNWLKPKWAAKSSILCA